MDFRNLYFAGLIILYLDKMEELMHYALYAGTRTCRTETRMIRLFCEIGMINSQFHCKK